MLRACLQPFLASFWRKKAPFLVFLDDLFAHNKLRAASESPELP